MYFKHAYGCSDLCGIQRGETVRIPCDPLVMSHRFGCVLEPAGRSNIMRVNMILSLPHRRCMQH